MLRSFTILSYTTGQTRDFHVNDGYADSIQVHNIDGLDPSDARILKTQYADIPGESYQGTVYPGRNIVIQFKLKPSYASESVQSLREELYILLQKGVPVDLNFHRDHPTDPELTIRGYVENIEAPLFVQEPLLQVSIVCPKAYFTSVTTPVTVSFSGDSTNFVFTGDIRGTAPTPYEMRFPLLNGKLLNQVFLGFRALPNDGGYRDGLSAITPNVSYPDGSYVSFYNYPPNRSFQIMGSDGLAIRNLLTNVQPKGVWPDLIPKSQYIVAASSYSDFVFSRIWSLIYTPSFTGV